MIEEPNAEQHDALSLSKLAGKHSPRISSALATFAAGQVAYGQLKRGYQWLAARNANYIYIEQDDLIYETVLEDIWRLASDNKKANKHLEAISRDADNNPALVRDPLALAPPADVSSRSTSAAMKWYAMHVRPQVMGTVKFILDEHVVYAELIDNRSTSSKFSHGDDVDNFFSKLTSTQQLRITAKSNEAKSAVLAWLDACADQMSSQVAHKPVFYLSTNYGHWSRRADVPTRDLRTVILDEGVKEDIVADIEQFLADEQHYVDIGAPWHRSFLLYGPPGTGKTSLARAIAAYFNFDIYFISVSDIEKSSTLLELVSTLGPRSLLVLEDIDTVRIATSRDESETSTVTMSAILNALDGVFTPHGLITIMTTNHLERLDPAITRTGRTDRLVRIGYVTTYQVKQLVALVNPDAEIDFEVRAEISASDVTEVIKTSMHDEEEMLARLKTLCVDGKSED